MGVTVRIVLPVAAPISYNPSYYIAKVFAAMGHLAEVVDQSRFYEIPPDGADLFVGVDSGGPLNIPEDYRSKSCMWYIDSRRNSDPNIRNPDDDTTATELIKGEGMVFQAQLQDSMRLHNKLGAPYNDRVKYLPLAADPEVWSDEPRIASPEYISAFIGNCYDPIRLGALGGLQEAKLTYWPGIEQAIMEDGALVYRNSRVGLNIPSFYGTPECYDINMRVFEIMSCGKIAITNDLENLALIGIRKGLHVDTYNSIEEIPALLARHSRSEEYIWRGKEARRYILTVGTYKHRAETILRECKRGGLYT